MGNRTKFASIAFTGAAAAAATGFTAPPALASAGTWHIKTNGTGSHGHYSASATSGVTFVDDTAGITMTCPIGHVSGSIPSSNVASTPPFTKLGVISGSGKTFFGTTARPCTIGGLQNFKFTLNKTMDLSAKSYNMATGVTTGRIHGPFSMNISGIGNACHAKIVGQTNPASIPGTYTNSTHILAVNESPLTVKSDLKIESVTAGCIGWHNGDNIHIAGNFTVFSPFPLTISHP